LVWRLVDVYIVWDSVGDQGGIHWAGSWRDVVIDCVTNWDSVVVGVRFLVTLFICIRVRFIILYTLAVSLAFYRSIAWLSRSILFSASGRNYSVVYCCRVIRNLTSATVI
jgi:hypothetical protein